MKTAIRTLVVTLSMATLLSACSKGDYYWDSYGSYGEYLESANEVGDRFENFVDNPFIDTEKEPVSTFSVDADGASYAIMRKYLKLGRLPDKSSVRIEEYLNYFTFDYPEPVSGDLVGMNYEIAQCPWNSKNSLLRIGLKGKSLKERPQSNFVFLIDVSGSMNAKDKIDLLKKGMTLLVDRLDSNDRISIITYSGKVKKVLESTLVKDAATIKAAIKKLSASGVTNGGEALKMAYKEARENFIEGGNNRIILGTDGDFNVGVTSTNALLEMVENEARTSKIYLTVCGFGSGNLNDRMMEKVSNSGNGTYEYIDCEEQMEKVFVSEIGKFFTVASDVKAQVSFNPAKVAKYRLIGYENRVMNNVDFENDAKDAAEIGAGQTVTALYELVPTEGDVRADYATLAIRYKGELNTESIERSMKLSDFSENPSESFSFAASLASFGMVLRDSPYKGDATISLAKELADKGLVYDPDGFRGGYTELIGLCAKMLEN